MRTVVDITDTHIAIQSMNSLTTGEGPKCETATSTIDFTRRPL